MRKVFLGIVCCVCCLPLSSAQDAEESTGTVYEVLQLHHFGQLEGNLNGKLRELSGGVKMSLIAEKEEDNLDIEAEKVTFGYGEGDEKSPVQMILDKNVKITTSGGSIQAGHATIDFDTKEAVFTGSPKADFTDIRGVEVELIRLNLDTGDIFAGGPGKIREIPLQRDDDSADSSASNPRN